jgi:signal transduction histidine kinase/ActR/RegA family two-component response regulator
VAVPLLTHERLIGALTLWLEPGRVLSPDELQALEALADQASLAFENARLYASARDSLVRLRDTQMQLVQAAKMSALGQLVSGVAHELNNPLSVIVGYGQLMLTREMPAVMKRPIELIVGQADRMAKIVRNLLFFSRQSPPGRAAIILNDVIEQTLSLRLNQLTLAGIAVERDLAPGLPPIVGDPNQLEQVFLNLLLNAEQAIQDGKRGGRILLRTSVAAGGRAVKAQVIDDGPGIPEEALPRVFEPFFTTKEVGSGTGLGLSVSYGVVQEHGGQLGVESRPGQTIFTLELPVVRSADLAGAEAALEPRVIHGQGRLALVLEDEPAVRDLIVTLLGQTGWRVEIASGGRAGLESVHRRRYDLVVSDVRMPEGGGEEFYRSAIALDETLLRRFVFITGDTATRDAFVFLKEADLPVIAKPFQPALFLDAVRRVTISLTPSAPRG